MYLFRCVGTAVFGVIGGLLGNLAATSIYGSWGQFTLKEALPMVLGAVLLVALASAIEQWASRPSARKLEQRLAFHRDELHKLERTFQVDKAWTPAEEAAWRDHQEQIRQIKEALARRGKEIPSDPYDLRPPPPQRLGPIARLWLVLRRSTLSFALPAALIGAYLLSPAAQHEYLALRATPSSVPVGTPTYIARLVTSTPPARGTPTSLPTASPPARITTAPAATPTALATMTARPAGTPMPTRTPPSSTSTPKSTRAATPTAPPQCPDPGVRIAQPATDAVLTGTVLVQGTASIPVFFYYKLELGAGTMPADWALLGALQSTPITDGVLGAWDSSAYPAGAYVLRLVVVDNTGNYGICEVRVHIEAQP
jgi:hypothetical protein